MNVFLFLGSRRGLAALKKLLSLQAKICGILCLIEDAHEEPCHEKITQLAQEKNIPIFYSNQVKPNQYEKIVQQCAPDMAFAIGWRFLIDVQTYQLPPKGTLIIHDSLLPQYRGFAPMNWALINGETETGVTLFFVDGGVDSGPIVDQLKISISSDDNAQSLDEKIIGLYETILEKNLPRLETGHYQTIPQNESEATFTCKRIPEDGLIDWHQSAKQIHNLVRGTGTPFPGAFTDLNGKRVIIWQTQVPTEQKNYVGVVPGRVLGKKNGFIEVLTGKGILYIETLQIQGEKKINANDFSISVKDTFTSKSPTCWAEGRKL